MKFERRTAENGLRIIVAPMESTETVTLLVLVGTGANYETKNTSGLSHFLEHMFFKATKNYPRPGDLDRVLDSVGSMHNAFTSREETGYWIKVDSKQFPLALHWVSEILQNALLKEEDIKRERGVILEEYNMWKDNPRREVWTIFERLLYGNNPYGWEILGPPENIRRMPRSAFLRYWKNQYVASNTVVVVAGKVSHAGTFSKIERAFARLRRAKPGGEYLFKSIESGPRAAVLEKETAQTNIVVGTPGYPLKHRNQYTADVLATILGGYMSSRLFSEIREKLGLAYATGAGHQAHRHTGYFAAYAGVPHTKAPEVASRILANFARIKKSGVTSEELSRAKENIKGRLAISLESTDEVASFLGEQEILLSKIERPEDFVKKIEKITREDVGRVARNLFEKKKLHLAIMGPQLKKATYEKILSGF